MDLAASADPVAAFRAAQADGDLVLLRTSGSRSTPRAVLRTTESWVESFDHVSRLAGLGHGSRVWLPGPLTASMNLFALVHTSYAGGSTVHAPDTATHAVLTPAALAAALDHDGLAGVTAIVAGDRLSRALHARAVEAGVAVHHYYGAAELSFVAWGGHAEDLRPFPGVEVETRDGEIWVRSPYVCTGYDGPPGPLRRDRSGFASVGDRGRLRGEVLEVDGRPGAVTTGGATVQVADVERELRGAAQGELLVLAVPHARLGAVVTVVLTDAADHARLTRLSRERLDSAAQPRVWHLVERLPLTTAGKVDRRAVVDLLTGDDPPRRLT